MMQQSGRALLAAKPEMAELVGPRMDQLTGQFDRLEENAREEGERLFDAKRADLYDQSCDDIDSFARDIEAQIETEPMEKLKDLTSVNIMMQKQQLIETQMIVKSPQMTVARKGGFVKDVLILDTFCINYPTAPKTL